MTSRISDYHYAEENQPDLMAGTEWSLSEYGKAIFESSDAPYGWGNINVGSPTLSSSIIILSKLLMVSTICFLLLLIPYRKKDMLSFMFLILPLRLLSII